jgi:hypothetical protein
MLSAADCVGPPATGVGGVTFSLPRTTIAVITPMTRSSIVVRMLGRSVFRFIKRDRRGVNELVPPDDSA